MGSTQGDHGDKAQSGTVQVMHHSVLTMVCIANLYVVYFLNFHIKFSGSWPQVTGTTQREASVIYGKSYYILFWIVGV